MEVHQQAAISKRNSSAPQGSLQARSAYRQVVTSLPSSKIRTFPRDRSNGLHSNVSDYESRPFFNCLHYCRCVQPSGDTVRVYDLFLVPQLLRRTLRVLRDVAEKL